jgi:D-glycero-alpha-D-manno-heptose-7-phosphate kinase
MIVTKTPLRISFFGGGSDIPEFYNNNQGLCVSAAINSYIYIAAHKCVAPHLKVIYSELELETDIEKIKHDRVREVLKDFGITSNMEICSFSDIPVKGTGLGSSSTFTVGLINAINKIKYPYKDISRKELAETASYIEIEKCKEPIGKQDQYAAAHGGLRAYRFNRKDVEVSRINTSTITDRVLSDRLMCFNTGVNRLASSILTEQVDNLKNNVNVLLTRTLVNMAESSIKMLEENRLDDFGSLLNDAWQVKKQLSSNVTNDSIDDMYERAIKAGALGGKILGAGGGGYLLLYVRDKDHRNVYNEMTKSYEYFPIRFDYNGSTIEMKS